MGGPHPFLVVWCLAFSSGLGLMLWIFLSLAGDAIEAIPAARSRRVGGADSGDGPTVLHGKLGGPPRVAPLGGAVVVGHHSVVEHVTGSGKNVRREKVCMTSQLEGMTLDVDGRVLALELPQERIDVLRPGSLSARGDDALLVLAKIEDGEPSRSALASRGCQAPAEGRLELRQLAWTSGQPAVVSGCRRGDRLVPCGDGADFLVSDCDGGACRDAKGGVEALVGFWRSSVEGGGAVLLGVVGMFFTGLGGFNLWGQRKLQRRRRAVARGAR